MTEFDQAQQARIELKAAIANREIKVLAMRANADIAKLVSHHIRSMAQSRRFWNERNRGEK